MLRILDKALDDRDKKDVIFTKADFDGYTDRTLLRVIYEVTLGRLPTAQEIEYFSRSSFDVGNILLHISSLDETNVKGVTIDTHQLDGCSRQRASRLTGNRFAFLKKVLRPMHWLKRIFSVNAAAIEQLKTKSAFLEQEINSLKEKNLEKILNDTLSKKLDAGALTEFIDALQGKADLVDIERLRASISEISEKINDYRAVALELERLRWLISSAEKLDTQKLSTTDSLSDIKYRLFEKSFRGTTKEISEKNKIYIDFLEKYFNNKDIECLDIATGRGEWLGLLSRNGFKKAKGIEENTFFLEETEKRHLNVKNSNMFNFFSEAKDDTYDVVSMFHVAERLNVENVDKAVNELHRIMKKDAILIIEYPNIKNIITASYYYYINPLRERPMPDKLLIYILENNLFQCLETVYVNVPDDIKNYRETDFERNYVSIGADCAMFFKNVK
jgi:ubiquinone/menaquinone biosynthesis C-methylase UbiE